MKTILKYLARKSEFAEKTIPVGELVLSDADAPFARIPRKGEIVELDEVTEAVHREFKIRQRNPQFIVIDVIYRHKIGNAACLFTWQYGPDVILCPKGKESLEEYNKPAMDNTD